MKLCLYLVVLCIGFIRASPLGNIFLNLGLNLLDCEHRRDLNLDVSWMDVYLYDFQYGVYYTFPINEAAQGILSLNTLNKNKKFFMYVDGFKTHKNKETIQLVRNAFKNFLNSYLIIIDHSAYTNSHGLKESYEKSVKYVYYIGIQLAQMLVHLHANGISAQNIHCIGHSLGSQMLAYVGEIFFEMTGQKISRITALDPAGPCFSDSMRRNQIRSGVAEYVEVYHCNSGEFGTSSVLGDIDFFVNNGQFQPNCGTSWILGFLDTVLTSQCCHRRCVTMWVASAANQIGYTAYKCDNYESFIDGKCYQNDRAVAGFWNPGNATGVHYFSTEGYNFT